MIPDFKSVLFPFLQILGDVGDFAFDKINESLKQNGLGHIPIKHRHSTENFHFCKCNLAYTILFNSDFNEFKKTI